MKPPLVIYWSRRDFRLSDNPALTRAVKESKERKAPLLPLFVLEDYMVLARPEAQFGYPSRWFLAHALPEFARLFPLFGIVRGKAAQYFILLGQRYDLTVYVNDDVYPDFEIQVKKLEESGIRIHVLSDALSVPVGVRTGEGKVYSVFTPFKKAVWADFVGTKPLPAVSLEGVEWAKGIHTELGGRIEGDAETLMREFSTARTLLVGGTLIDIGAHTELPSLTGWYVSEKGARTRFIEFLRYGFLEKYDTARDSLEGDVAEAQVPTGTFVGQTSRMSLALAWGLVSARTLMAMIRNHFDESFDNPFSDRVNQGALSYVSELIWREFYRYLFVHHPSLMDTEFQERFRGTIEWVPDHVAKERLVAWIRGETGYPIVDAAMGQIARTGWMHNRARMIVASVLTKNLGVDWRWGQEYFRAALIDLDEASNNGGWQWGASVGADPKPIRIFNPELQAKNYDGSGAYREKWLSLGDAILQSERVPLVEHTVAREEALRRYGLTHTKPRDY